MRHRFVHRAGTLALTLLMVALSTLMVGASGDRAKAEKASSLPEKERREMVKLQRTDPEKFRKVMTEKGEALLKADRDRLIELRSMVAEYISTADSDRREELYKKIEANVRFDYFKRLEENRRHLEEMKRRARGLEAELNKREKNAEAAIKARIDAILRGDPDPEAPRPHPRRKK